MSTSTKNSSSLAVAILMCTFNGEIFIKEQIESIQKQTFKNWVLYISDDGSTDKTIEIIHSFKKTLGKKLVLLKGPQKGYVENFIFITRSASAHYYFWCDQDDIWLPKKIERALSWLKKQPKSIEILYCARSYLTDSHNQIFGFSPLFNKPPSLENAIIQNIGSGNTIAFNNNTKNLFLSIKDTANIVTHDWLLYQIVTAVNGNVFYDDLPNIYYRQHDNNAIGMTIGVNSVIRHLKLIFNGTLRTWNNKNLLVLSKMTNVSDSSKLMIDELKLARKKSYLAQLKAYQKLRIYRQSFLGQMALYFSIVIGKF